ncbi:nucleotide-diphospho-sugar transferase [Setomelanomma holmii]|uniref:Nucleotide-diphospho-sugar transferase n=1 Tax=Setomelanomma holmii TaxID=210430 RepID=A0A9P4GW92_9PLEO|nr:nucleotide-diphospho-sugar transferase [Setomelanomma holmii]
MRINSPHCISTVLRIGGVLLFLFTCGTYFLPQNNEVPLALKTPSFQVANLTEASSTFNASVVDFWQDLASALLETQPQCKPLKVMDESVHYPEDHFDPLEPYRKHPHRLVGFTDDDETALLRAHFLMRKSAFHLAPKLSFAKGTTGIVTTADTHYMPMFLVSLRMLRRTGCNLPVEVFIDDWSKYDTTTCDIVLPSLNARCVVLSNIYNKNTKVKKPDHYQYKILSILFSTFQHVLFLDSDAFPSYDPSVLFTIPPYTTHGLVTWPDFFALTINEHFYHIAAIPEEPASARFSTESGQLLLNKDTHRESLLIMETFVQAAMAVGLPWYQVRTGPAALGRNWNGMFRGTAIAQADPGLDYEYGIPMRSHVHTGEWWTSGDSAHPDPKTEKSLNRTRTAPRRPRPVFIHQNMLNLNPEKVLADKGEITYEPDGTMHRMWGSKEDMEKLLGYDVERRLWDVVAEEGCRLDQGSETCAKIRAYVSEVFGWMGEY